MALTKERMSGELGALAERAHGVGAATSDLHLLQDALELAGQRSFGVAGHLLERGVEAEPRLDRDRQQVDGVGQRVLHLLVALGRGVVEPDALGPGSRRRGQRPSSRIPIGKREARGSARSRQRRADARRSRRGSVRTAPDRPSTRAGCRRGRACGRMRSSWSAPLTRRPRRWKRWSKGSRTRSPNGLSSSAVSSGEEAPSDSSISSDRATPRFGPVIWPNAGEDQEEGAEDHQRSEQQG